MKLKKYLQNLMADLEDYQDGDADYQATVNLDHQDTGFPRYVVDRALRAARREGIQCSRAARFTVSEGLNVLAGLIREASGDAAIGDGPYRVAEAATILGVSTRHVYDLCHEGKISHTRSPIRITKEALEHYIQQSERQPVKTTGFRHL